MSRGYAAVGLHFPKNPLNVGSALRAVSCFDVAFLATSGSRYSRAPTNVYKTEKNTPLFQVDDLKNIIPYSCIPVAVDLVPGATNLIEYVHPERAFYIFGPEDGTLGNKVLSWCSHKVVIPMIGCMNLAAAVNVVLYDRLAKRNK